MIGFNSDRDLGARPPPPPLPKYDPAEEAPKWDWTRLKWGLPPIDKQGQVWPRAGHTPESDDEPDWRGVIRKNIIVHPLPEPYKYGQPLHEHYFWFDTPDYADPFKKLWYSFKWFSATGLAWAAGYGSLFSKTFSLSEHLRLIKLVTVPWFLGGMAASLTVLTVSNIRNKKDDLYNYAIAAMVAACVTGRKNHVAYFQHNVLWMPPALYVKYNAETNGHLVPFRHNWGMGQSPLSGYSADHGIMSGDFRGIKGNHGDPGRGVRTFPL